MAYLLDANIFIQARNLQYGFDFCPAFWDWLEQNNATGTVFSIQQVGDELQAGGDDLSDWATARGDGFFLPPDEVVLPALPRVSAWATGQNYEPVAVNTFLQVADYWLVCPCPRPYRGHARSPREFDAQDQDPKRLRRIERALHDAVPDAAA